MQLSEDFIRTTRAVMGPERFERYMAAYGEEAPVSLRLNPRKTAGLAVEGGERVAWCDQGWYLPRRPVFTFDPLLHAGCYYVQEAASMFLDAVLRQHLPQQPVAMLDLCAAPGGKSSLALSLLPPGSCLYSNEPIRSRANILLENIAKWGDKACFVTNNYPRDYRKSRLQFDVVLCDVPCSGEGMFRKDPATIGEWSLQNVEKCWRLQRDIVSDAWHCLRDGGLFIYSTCTFNIKENEENIRWMTTELGAQVLPVDTKAEWQITGSLLEGFDVPVYRFIPGITRGEGLFMCALRKGSTEGGARNRQTGTLAATNRQFATSKLALSNKHASPLTFLLTPNFSLQTPNSSPVPLTYQQAMAYLRHEALVLPEGTPRGIVEVAFEDHVLGLVKNIGPRANNLYPKEWKIKTTHIPNDYEAILRPA